MTTTDDILNKYVVNLLQTAYNDLPTLVSAISRHENIGNTEALKKIQTNVINHVRQIGQEPSFVQTNYNNEIRLLQSEIKFIKSLYAKRQNDYEKNYYDLNTRYITCTKNRKSAQAELALLLDNYANEQRDGSFLDKYRNKIKSLKLKIDELDAIKASLLSQNQQTNATQQKNNVETKSLLFKLLQQINPNANQMTIEQMTQQISAYLTNTKTLKNTIDSLTQELDNLQSDFGNRDMEYKTLKIDYEKQKHDNDYLYKRHNKVHEQNEQNEVILQQLNDENNLNKQRVEQLEVDLNKNKTLKIEYEKQKHDNDW